MELITPEIAEIEVKKWLDFKKVNAKKRESYKDNIETIVNAIVSGKLVLDPGSFIFTQTLDFPLSTTEDKEQITVITLVYKPRLTVKQIQIQLQGVKGTDFTGMIIAHVVALTGKVKEIISQMDTEDYSIAQSIAIFFL